MTLKVKPKPKPKPNLQKKIAAAASALDIAAPSISTGEGKTYEAWVLLEIAAGLKRVGIEVEARNHQDKPTTAFKVRGGPGNIRPASSAKADEPCHFALLNDWRQEWELHASVKHQGLSGDKHELDISVIQKRGADICRDLPNGGPYKGRRIMGLELKQFGDDSFLDKGVARALLGVAVDLDPGVVITGVSIQMALGPEAWFSITPTRADYRLLTSALIRPASVDYLKSYGVQSAQALAPGNDEALHEIVQYLASMMWW